MQISTKSIVPITEATKHFRAVCDKTKKTGSVFVFKNNLPEIVMMNMKHYEMLMSVVDNIEHAEIHKLVTERERDDNGKRYTLAEVIDLK